MRIRLWELFAVVVYAAIVAWVIAKRSALYPVVTLEIANYLLWYGGLLCALFGASTRRAFWTGFTAFAFLQLILYNQTSIMNMFSPNAMLAGWLEERLLAGQNRNEGDSYLLAYALTSAWITSFGLIGGIGAACLQRRTERKARA